MTDRKDLIRRLRDLHNEAGLHVRQGAVLTEAAQALEDADREVDRLHRVSVSQNERIRYVEQERDAALAVIAKALDVTPLGGSVANLRGVVDEMRRILAAVDTSALDERELTVRPNPAQPSDEALAEMVRLGGIGAVWRNGCDAGMLAP